MLREIIEQLIRANVTGKPFPRRPLRLHVSRKRIGQRTYTGLSKKIGSVRIPTR